MPKVKVNGVTLWYSIMGEGEPLLLHHGYTACRDNWMPVAEALQHKYQVILMECRGTGESEDTVDGYNLTQYAEDVIGLMDHLDIKKLTFAGHSMGGGIAYLLGLNYPDRLNKLILMAPIPSGGIQSLPNDGYFEKRLNARKNNDRTFFKSEMEASRFREDVQTDAWFESRVDQLLRVSDAHMIDGMQTMYDLDVEDQLSSLEIPTLMIAGAVDSLIGANIKDYQRLPDASLHVFSRAGHDVAIHEPQGVSDAIDAFMEFGPMNSNKLAAS